MPGDEGTQHTTPRSARALDDGQRGSSLVIALVFLVFFAAIATALLQQGFTSEAANAAQQQVQNQDAAGDAAIQVAIDRLSGAANTNPNPNSNPAYIVSNLGRDPLLFPSDPPCIFNVPSTLKSPTTGALLKVTTTCAADAGSNSGKLASGPLPTDTPLQPRIMTISACLRAPSLVDTDTAACGATSGDRMIVQAQVRFDVTVDVLGEATGVPGSAAANLPEILSWNHVLLNQAP